MLRSLETRPVDLALHVHPKKVRQSVRERLAQNRYQVHVRFPPTRLNGRHLEWNNENIGSKMFLLSLAV